eukprot:358308-Chlamydomonas_euryale.AAC.3
MQGLGAFFTAPGFPANRRARLQSAPSVYVKPRRGDPCTKHASRPQVKANYNCRGRGPTEAKAGVIGRDRRPRRACFVQGLNCQGFACA